MNRTVFALAFAACACVVTPAAQAQTPVEYRVLATSKTSTMQKELSSWCFSSQEAAGAGFRFGAP